MSEIDLRGMSRDELTDLLQKVMIRLRHVDAEELKNNYVTKSQRLRLEEAIKNQLKQRDGQA
jgi:hypothetical protein